MGIAQTGSAVGPRPVRLDRPPVGRQAPLRALAGATTGWRWACDSASACSGRWASGTASRVRRSPRRDPQRVEAFKKNCAIWPTGRRLSCGARTSATSSATGRAAACGPRRRRPTRSSCMLRRASQSPASVRSTCAPACSCTPSLRYSTPPPSRYSSGDYSAAGRSPRGMVVVLDNARYHHAKLLRPLLSAHRQHLELHFLPPYSPQLAPIERVLEADAAISHAQPVLRQLGPTEGSGRPLF